MNTQITSEQLLSSLKRKAEIQKDPVIKLEEIFLGKKHIIFNQEFSIINERTRTGVYITYSYDIIEEGKEGKEKIHKNRFGSLDTMFLSFLNNINITFEKNG
jgi:hypothetical protein